MILSGGFLERHRRLIVIIFFAVLLGLGLAGFRDYGISWDEPNHRLYAEQAYRYVRDGDEELFSTSLKNYGPAFQLLLYSAERTFGLEDSRTIYLMRHLVTFLVFWLGVLLFYLLCKRLFGSWRIGLLGAGFLVLSPRIFAHAFYNPADLPLAMVFIAGIYTLVRYLDTKSVRAAVIHAVVCAIAVDIRVVGLMLPALTLLFMGIAAVEHRFRRGEMSKILLGLAVYIPVFACVTALLWPTLWQGPVRGIIGAFDQMGHVTWQGAALYWGKHLAAGDIPWHYAPVWMAITVPLAYVFCFLLGTGLTILSIFTRLVASPVVKWRNRLIILLWFILPLIYLALTEAVIYDGWRHIFFIYPALIILALTGLIWLWRRLRRGHAGVQGPAGGWWRIAAAAVVLALVLNLGIATLFMIRYHPYQNLYFNALVGGTKRAEGRFDLDYWGLAYRGAFEYILREDSRDEIKIYVSQETGKDSALMLTPDQRKRLVFVEKSSRSNYHLTNFRWQDREQVTATPWHTIEVGGATIMAIYRVRL